MVLVVLAALAWYSSFRPCTPGQTIVLGRLRDGTAASVDYAPTRKMIGTSARSAVTVSESKPLEVELPLTASHVRFSLGATGAGSGTVNVGIEDATGAKQSLQKIDLTGPSADWSDFEIAVGSGTPPLRLQIEASAATVSNPMQTFVGSLSYHGPVPCEPALHSTATAPSRPDIVLISLDTLGANMLGRAAASQSISPFLDTLREEGADFSNAFVSYPNTIVSHATMFTGLHPRHHEVYGGLRSMLRSRTLAEHLADAGYLTAAFTEDAYVGSGFGFDRGFDSYDDGDHAAALAFGGDSATTFRRARDWLKHRSTGAPVFLFVHTYEVHSPYVPRDERAWEVTRALKPGYSGKYADGFEAPLDEFAHNSGKNPMPAETLEYLRALHQGEVNYLDRRVEELFAAIRESLPARSTLIVVTSDHGEEFGEHGRLGHGETLSDNVLRVPLVFLWPGKIAPRSTGVPISSVDLTPTLLDLLDLTPTDELDGRSYAAFLLGEKAQPTERPVIAELASALGDCRRQGLPPDCPVDRVAVRAMGLKLIDSVIPKEARLFSIEGDSETEVQLSDHPREVAMLGEIVDFYRRLVPNVPADSDTIEPVDKGTEERLRALGYL
jgi:arylsulfatase A-like enzyme